MYPVSRGIEVESGLSLCHVIWDGDLQLDWFTEEIIQIAQEAFTKSSQRSTDAMRWTSATLDDAPRLF